MIFKIKKKLYAESADAAIKTPIGELFCKIASLPNGYYFYNKSGVQLAQVVFTEGGAELSLVLGKPSFPGAVIMRAEGADSFSFSGNEIGTEDKSRIGGLTSKGAAHKFSIWGKPSEYSYQIYDGSNLVAEIVPSEADLFEIATTEHTNLLYVLMIALAAEKLSF